MKVHEFGDVHEFGEAVPFLSVVGSLRLDVERVEERRGGLALRELGPEMS